MSVRVDFSVISGWVESGSRVLDLGCGHGTLLHHLATTQGCRVQGVEMDSDCLHSAVSKGVPVLGMNIDQELDGFDDNSYDAVILSRTVQAIHQPATVLTHMKRIAPTVIVSMPNFAYWRNRFRLMAGRAPVSKDLPYAWHDSPNVHFGSCRDLECLFEELGLTVMQCIALSSSGKKSRFPTKLRNLTAGAALYRLTTTDPR